MFIINVSVHVRPELVDDFKAATIENASNSLKEPGVARFDVLQQQDDPSQFVLVEAYRTPDDHAKHRETAHYRKWRDTVVDWMAEPRKGVRHEVVCPVDRAAW